MAADMRQDCRWGRGALKTEGLERTGLGMARGAMGQKI